MPYFHVVFTLPVEIAAIAFCNRRVVFNVLFRTAAETLRTIAEDPRHGGVRIGGTAVLHTWDQKLLFHPHLHVVVPNAGFDVDSGEWKTGSSTFLAPVKVLASLFRRRFLEELARAHGRGELGFHGTVAYLHNPGEFHAALAAARSRDWVAYAKRPFRGPEQVFTYLSRYTHRNHVFHDLASLNRAIAARARKINERPYADGTGENRYSRFESVDLLHMRPLPDRRWQRTQWRKNTVHRDYHIAIDRHFYSVPYQYVGKEVDVRLRGSVIDVFHRGRQIASHLRS